MFHLFLYRLYDCNTYNSGKLKGVKFGICYLLLLRRFLKSLLGLPSESEAVPSSAGYYSAKMGGVDDPVIEVLRRSTGGEEGIRDALRYLDALDKFYGEAGRPR